MDCKEFQYWLTRRDVHDGLLPSGARDHMGRCPECRVLIEKDRFLEQHIAAAFAQTDLPLGMKERISRSLGRQNFFARFTGKQKRITMAGAGLVTVLIVVAFSFLTFYSSPPPVFQDLNQITQQAVTDHLKGNRSMSFDGHETEQALTMLTRELGFKVILPDLAPLGCTLVGGRLCSLGDCRAAYFIVEHGGKTGSLFIMGTDHIRFPMADGNRFNTRIKGYDAWVWQDNDQVYAMVF